jgi:hypothetical protein
MNSTKFSQLLNNVIKTNFYKDINTELLEIVQRKHKFKFLNEKEFNDTIDKLKKFDINKLWERNFWGLSLHESISAIASEPYNTIVRIREGKF